VSADTSGGSQSFFHATTGRAAEEILASGFRDAEGSHGFPMLLRGVFLSDSPIDENDGALSSEALLEILMPGNIDLSRYEIVEELRSTREWCVPAIFVNEHAEVRLIDDEEAGELQVSIPDEWPDRCLACLIGIPQLSEEDGVQVGLCPECGAPSFRRAP